MHAPIWPLALLASLSFGACIQDTEVQAPPMNEFISSDVGERALQATVECEGPAEELALLGSLCGSSTSDMYWRNTNASGAGMATIVGESGATQLIISNEIERNPSYEENVAAEVAHAAFLVLDSDPAPESIDAALNQWREGEAVASGEIIVERVQFVACSQSWLASANFYWRATKISLSWAAYLGC